MGVFGRIIKNAAVGTAVGVYGVYKTAEGSIKKQMDLAKMEELLEREATWQKETEHFSQEEREKMIEMAKKFSMADLAKRSAKDRNNLNRLKFKYGLIEAK